MVSSGPGEVSNWAVPLGRAAAAWADRRGLRLTLSLVLTPCQFASGQEAAYARRHRVFERVLGPATCVGLVAGLARLPLRHPACVLHLGGDLWYSTTLGRRLGCPAFAYVETPLVRKRAHQFQRIFLPSQALADLLRSCGVPAERLAVVGDLRVDALAGHRPEAPPSRTGSRVAFLPGSRRWIVQGMLPLFLDAAETMRQRRDELRFSMLASPFLREDVLDRLLGPYRVRLERLGIEIVRDHRLDALAESDLAITVPGTNTVELAILGVPMVVVLPLNRPAQIRTEGLSEWLSRLPGIGAAVKGLMARRFLRRGQFVAWPNREAGRLVVPELVGRLTPADIAQAAMALLADPAGLDGMAHTLRTLYSTPAGVAARVLDAMAPWLGVGSPRASVLA